MVDIWEEFLCEIFLDLHKTYDASNIGRCLDILASHVIYPHLLCILILYWGRIYMVSQGGGYFGSTFKGQHRMT